MQRENLIIAFKNASNEKDVLKAIHDIHEFQAKVVRFENFTYEQAMRLDDAIHHKNIEHSHSTIKEFISKLVEENSKVRIVNLPSKMDYACGSYAIKYYCYAISKSRATFNDVAPLFKTMFLSVALDTLHNQELTKDQLRQLIKTNKGPRVIEFIVNHPSCDIEFLNEVYDEATNTGKKLINKYKEQLKIFQDRCENNTSYKVNYKGCRFSANIKVNNVRYVIPIFDIVFNDNDAIFKNTGWKSHKCNVSCEDGSSISSYREYDYKTTPYTLTYAIHKNKFAYESIRSTCYYVSFDYKPNVYYAVPKNIFNKIINK